MSSYLDTSVGADTRYFSHSSFGLVRKNLTFNGTKFNLNGMQSKTVYSSLSNLNQDKLESFSNIVKKNLNLNSQSEIKTSSDLEKHYEFANEVSFKDKVSGNRINLRLSTENLERLKTYFGSQNFDKDKNGQITLKGEAENFVSGWFGDIAYKRNYVGADTDKNGFLNDSEKGDTLTGYSTEGNFAVGKGFNISFVYMQGISSYLAYNKHYDTTLPNTIEKVLNSTLKADANMDGYLTLGELQSKEEIIALTQKNIEGKSRGLPDMIKSLEELLERMSKENKETVKELDIDYEKILNAKNYASVDEYFRSLEKEIQGIQSISISLKVSEELVINNLDNASFTKDLNALIAEIKEQATNALKVDISA
ncbi:hypothetical protein [Campylobacter troglodytis]|uniref:hypothetical protein n=1 Tax=Campylobacter troglodytis TaxID=654363 RepID=UPI0011599F85|nr:hypothetical protein [Campylobacter troglodytis]TQR61625.1 hypothetical protein DMC01_00190 [Campylobacter troglodytis]